ncbi:MAG: efflux RND transporter periplasmic adaptor subunit [Candidatus Eremiobacteraeota bacterium]|nr:efflux RND transporter periplasmic adaptor subunit [Candidatus Eremiobacteraeota bacterium]
MLGLCLVVSGACAKQQAPTPPPQSVKVTAAQVRTVRPGLNLSGIIAPFQNVALSSALQEPTDAVYVNEGDSVHRGQALALLDTADLRANIAQAQAHLEQTQYQATLAVSQGSDQVRSAKAALDLARSDLARDQQLVSQGYISAQQVQTQRTTVAQAQAALNQAIENQQANGTQTQGMQKANIDQAAAAVQQLQAQIDKATIVSPVDGIVVNRNLNPGEYPGTRQIFTLQEVARVYAELNAYGTQITGIAPGTDAVLNAPAVPNRSFAGTVYSVLSPTTPNTNGFVVKVLVPNAARTLRPGMNVTGNISLPPRSGVAVPVSAFLDDTHQTVMTVQGDTAKIARVNEIVEDAHYAVVSGLTANTQVVTNGQTSVTDGQKVLASL